MVVDMQGCHEAVMDWIDSYEQVAVSQQCVIIMLHVCIHTHVLLIPSFTPHATFTGAQGYIHLPQA